MTKTELFTSDETTTAGGGDRLLVVHTRATSPSPTRQPQRILVSGDDVIAVAELVDAVSAPQREVHSTSCSDLALELALQLHFDLVVLHVDRPGAGGIEVSHCIRTCHELHQPVIVIISRPEDENSWAEAMHCGADLVLREPAGIPDATRALSAVLLQTHDEIDVNEG